MKLLTLNTHSLYETEYEHKCRAFADAVIKFSPDVIALQEVNQKKSAPIADISGIDCINISNVPMRADNHALLIHHLLEERGAKYNFCWSGIKTGYEVFDEGLCFFCKKTIDGARSFVISKINDYENWKRRCALLISCDGIRFCNVHMGWWNDPDEPFKKQWNKLKKFAKDNECAYIMGDFNADSKIVGEGYDLVVKDGWYDTFALAKVKNHGYTAVGKIDGWKDDDKKRIDYIFCRNRIDVKSSNVIFDGVNEEIVSDHFGVLVTI